MDLFKLRESPTSIKKFKIKKTKFSTWSTGAACTQLVPRKRYAMQPGHAKLIFLLILNLGTGTTGTGTGAAS